MKQKLVYDIKFLGGIILLCITLNVVMRKKSLDGFINIGEGNTNETTKENTKKVSLDAIKVIGEKSTTDNNDLVNWASWDPHDRKQHKVESAGSYSQYTNNEKTWS